MPHSSPLPWWTSVRTIDSGWLYIVENADLLKVGKTTDPKRRLFQAAKTWLPDAKIIGVKPFWEISDLERQLHCGLANYWYSGEWHKFPDHTHSDFLIDGFRMFDDYDRNKNSVDFIYWINGSGMGELIMEQNHRRISLRNWQREA